MCKSWLIIIYAAPCFLRVVLSACARAVHVNVHQQTLLSGKSSLAQLTLIFYCLEL